MNAVRVAILVATAAVCCVSSSPAFARPADTPLQMGLAGAGSLLLRGVDAPFGNPATLSWDRTPAVRLAASTGAVLNDTYTLHDYSRWNGATWSEDDKEEILSRIGADGLEGRFDTSVLGPAVAGSGWALNARSVFLGAVRVPREYAELALFGNQIGQKLELPRSYGEGIWYLDLLASGGRPIHRLGEFEISLGGSFHLLRGLRHAELLGASGTVETTPDAIDGAVVAESREASGGWGHAVDLAFAARRGSNGDGAPTATAPGRRTDATGTGGQGVHGPYEVGIVFRNVLGSVRWSDEPKLRFDTAVADSLSLSDGDEEDLIDTESSTAEIGAYSTRLPFELELSGAFWISDVRLEMSWTQGFEDGPATSTRPRIALGSVLYRRTHWSANAGVALGGIDGPVLGLGLRASVWRCDLDVAYQVLRGIDISLPKGIGLGVAITLHPGGRAAEEVSSASGTE